MENNKQFVWANERTEEHFRKRRGVDLLRLEPGKGHHVVFAQVGESRIIVGVHFPGGYGKSRKCIGDNCADCANKERLTFHLYALAFVGVPVAFPAIIDLATSKADEITTYGLDTTVVYQVFRITQHGPIKCIPNPNIRLDLAGFQGWDISNDIDRIFSGRFSPSTKQEKAPDRINSTPSASPESPLETKRKGRKG